MDARLPVRVSVHVDESTMVQTKAHGGVEPFALVALGDGRDNSVGLFFPTVADLDRVLEGLRTARHELAALTGEEPQAEMANTTMATRADAA